MSRRLKRLRASIDETDDGLVRLLARRRRLVLELAKVKASLGAAIRDPARERALMRRVQRLGAARGLPKAFVAALYGFVLRHSKRAQRHEARQ